MFNYEDNYMDKLASVQAYGVTEDEAYAAMKDAEGAYTDCMEKCAYAEEAYASALQALQAAEAMYNDNMDKIAYAEDLYNEAADMLGYKTAAEYVPLPETTMHRGVMGRIPAVRAGEPGSQAPMPTPLQGYAAAARAAM